MFFGVNAEFLSCIMSARSSQHVLISVFLFKTFETLAGGCKIVGTDSDHGCWLNSNTCASPAEMSGRRFRSERESRDLSKKLMQNVESTDEAPLFVERRRRPARCYSSPARWC